MASKETVALYTPCHYFVIHYTEDSCTGIGESSLLKKMVAELHNEIQKMDPKKKVEVGNYRLDAKGNVKHNVIPYALSEMHLSETLEKVCTLMDDYVRATKKDTGELILLKLLVDNKMNPLMSEVDVIQDGDLNKSLKYYCDGVIEEYEETIIKMVQDKDSAIEEKLCADITKLCDTTLQGHEEL